MGEVTGRKARRIADGFSFLEAPRWHDGRLIVSDFYRHTVFAIDLAGSVTAICEVAGQPSGLGFLPDGSMLVVSMTDRRVLRWANGRLEPHADLSSIAGFHCNDMLVDAAGNAYVGNFGWNPADPGGVGTARLALIAPDGQVEPVGSDLIFPNGMAMTADRRLLVAETFASRITAFDVLPDNGLGAATDWASFAPSPHASVPQAVASGAILPDGVALDRDGNLWVADAAGQGAVLVERGGRIIDRVDVAPLTAFAVALGGPDGRTLLLCAAPRLSSHDPARERRSMLLACEVETPAAWVPGR